MKFKSDIEIQAGLEARGSTGDSGQVLSSTGSGVAWIDQSAITSASDFVFFNVKNETGSTILKGKGIMAVGTDGNSGNILVDEMVANGTVEPKYFLGVLEEDIPNGGFARVISFGQLDQFNTNGQNGETWADGQILWCDPANPGDFTITEPDGPNVKIAAAFILNSSTNGKIQVRVQANEGIHDLHDTKITSQVDGDVLVWNNNTGVWFNDSTLNVDYANSKVGIGTDSPNQKLDVSGNIIVSDPTYSQERGLWSSFGPIITFDFSTFNYEIGNGAITYSPATMLMNFKVDGLNNFLSHNGFSEETSLNSSVGVNGSPSYGEVFTVTSTDKVSSPAPTMSGSQISTYSNQYQVQEGQMVYDTDQNRLLIGNDTQNFDRVAHIWDSRAAFPALKVGGAVSGNYFVSLNNLYHELVLTGPTTIIGTNINPTSNYGEELIMLITGDHPITFPSFWQLSPYSDSYDGTQKNLVRVTDYRSGVYYTIENMDTASGGGGDEVNENFEFTFDTSNSPIGTAIDFYVDIKDNGTITVDWGDGSPLQTYSGSQTINHYYPAGGVVDISISGDEFTADGLHGTGTGVGSAIVNISNWGNFSLKSYAFQGNTNMTITATDNAVGDSSLHFGFLEFVFSGCSNINPDVSNWDMSNVPYASYMFENCSSFNQSLEYWDISQLNGMAGILSNTAISVENYSRTLEAWGKASSVSSGAFFESPRVYIPYAQPYRDALEGWHGWTIFDNGPAY